MNTDLPIVLWTASAATGVVINGLLLIYSVRRWRQRIRDRERASIRTLAMAHAGRDAFRVLIQCIGLTIGLFALFLWHPEWIVWGLVSLQWLTVILAVFDYFANVRARNQEDAWEAQHRP